MTEPTPKQLTEWANRLRIMRGIPLWINGYMQQDNRKYYEFCPGDAETLEQVAKYLRSQAADMEAQEREKVVERLEADYDSYD